MAAGIPPDSGNSYVRWFLKRLEQQKNKKNARNGELPGNGGDTSTLLQGDVLALLIFLALVAGGIAWLVYTVTS